MLTSRKLLLLRALRTHCFVPRILNRQTNRKPIIHILTFETAKNGANFERIERIELVIEYMLGPEEN